VPAAITRSTFSMRTGIATLGAFAPRDQLLLALGRLAEDAPIDPIVHELMHHNAANSAVNVAMQYRWLALLRLSLSSPGFRLEQPEHRRIATDLAVTEALLQPLAEGLACFAEFDCAVPDAMVGEPLPVLTTVDWISLRLFSLRPDVGSYLPSMHRASVAEKLSARQVRRRADVLSHPLRPRTMNDAYLVGYLLVKAAWDVYVRGGGPARWPAGSFIEFVHYWFYEDWRLGALLLQPGDGGAYAVRDRIVSRARRLLDDDLPGRVDAFVRDKMQREERGMLMRGPEEREHGAFAGLEIGVDDIADASWTFASFYLSRVGPGAPVAAAPASNPVSLDEQMHSLMLQPLADAEPEAVAAYYERNPGTPPSRLCMLDFFLEIPQRNRARAAVLDLPIEVEIESGRIAALRADDEDEPWHDPPAELSTSLTGAGLRRGRLVGFAQSNARPWRLECFAVIDGSVRAAWVHGDVDEREHRDTMEQINWYEAFRVASGQSPEAFLTQAVRASELLEGADADEASLSVAMGLREVLAERGWSPLLGVSPAAADIGVRSWLPGPLVRALAATGLVNSYSTARAEVARRLEEHDCDLEQLLAACDRLAADHEVELVHADAETIRARV
jgi:hypothetical protein